MSKLLQARTDAKIRTHADMLKILQDEEGVKLTDPSIISHYEAGRVTPPTNTSIAIVRVLRRRKVLTSVEDLFGL